MVNRVDYKGGGDSKNKASQETKLVSFLKF